METGKLVKKNLQKSKKVQFAFEIFKLKSGQRKWCQPKSISNFFNDLAKQRILLTWNPSSLAAKDMTGAYTRLTQLWIDKSFAATLCLP